MASDFTPLTAKMIQELRALHLQTRKLVDTGISGQYKSAFHGRGIEFEDLREYQPGDEIRSIDWKVTARSRKPYIKSYREERELNVIIAVDVSSSTLTGIGDQTRAHLIAKVGAALTLIALKNNDRVGLVTFSNTIENFFPPRKARSAVWRILHQVLTPDKKPSTQTSLDTAFSFLNKVLKRTSVVFIISDFIDTNYERSLARLAKRHDVTAMVVTNPADRHIPNVSMLSVKDPETGKLALLDTSFSGYILKHAEKEKEAHLELRTILVRNRVNALELNTSRPFLPELKRYLNAKIARELRTLPLTD